MMFSNPSKIKLYEKFYFRYGPFPMMYWQWDLIGENMQLCLAGLRDVDRLVVCREFAMSLRPRVVKRC